MAWWAARSRARRGIANPRAGKEVILLAVRMAGSKLV